MEMPSTTARKRASGASANRSAPRTGCFALASVIDDATTRRHARAAIRGTCRGSGCTVISASQRGAGSATPRARWRSAIAFHDRATGPGRDAHASIGADSCARQANRAGGALLSEIRTTCSMTKPTETPDRKSLRRAGSRSTPGICPFTLAGQFAARYCGRRGWRAYHRPALDLSCPRRSCQPALCDQMVFALTMDICSFAALHCRERCRFPFSTRAMPRAATKMQPAIDRIAQRFLRCR